MDAEDEKYEWDRSQDGCHWEGFRGNVISM